MYYSMPTKIKHLSLVLILVIGVSAGIAHTYITRPPISQILTPTVAVPPSATSISSSQESLASYSIYHGVWRSSDSVPFLAKWYDQTLKQDGWIVVIPPNLWTDPQMQNIQFEKNGDFLHLSLEKKANAKETIISIDVIPASALSDDSEQ